MLVRLIGFTFTVEGNGVLTFSDFASTLAASRPNVSADNPDRRLLFINDSHDANYYVGLVVTIKDHRTFCELVASENSLLVKVNQLDRNSSLMDFNFFVVNKTTGSGLYQHYHQSCSVTGFGVLAANRFAQYREIRLKEALKALGDHASTAERKIRHEHANRLGTEIIVRKDALSTLIAEMKRVKAFEYCLSIPVIDQHAFAPLKPYVRRKSERIIFAQGTPIQLAADALGSFVSSSLLEKGRVEGEDEDGLPRILKIVDNPDSFGEYDYDDLAPKLNQLDLTQFHESWVISELIEKCKANKAVFEYQAAP